MGKNKELEWLWEETRFLKVVGLNPSTVYCGDIFSHVEKTKINEKEAGCDAFKKRYLKSKMQNK